MNRFFASLLLICASFLLAPQSAIAVTIDWITVGDPGDPGPPAYGAVPHAFRISKYDVTVSQYVEFLNHKDPIGVNTLGLYSTDMSDGTYGGIIFNPSSVDGSKYGVVTGRGNHPANYITWYDAIRFANWLNNGQGDGDTEHGAYTLLGGTPTPSNSLSITRNVGAEVFLPSESEWIKAGHHLPGTNAYFRYPTTTNTPPTGSIPTDLRNHANFGPNGAGNLTDVGAYTGTTSPYGAFDMAGNVLQWVDSEFLGPPEPILIRPLKGLSFADSWVGATELFTGRANAAHIGTNDYGFRVASSVPEPNAGLLLVFAGSTLWAWRRRWT